MRQRASIVPNLRGADGLQAWQPPARIASLPLPGWFYPGPLAFTSAARPLSQFSQSNKFYGAFCVLVFLGLLGAVPVTQARSLFQAGSPILQVNGPTQVTVGDTVQIRVILDQPQPPGVFGYQFRLNWDSAIVAPVEASPTLDPQFPLIAQAQVTPGQLVVAASRQGDVPDLTGSLTVLTWTFQAIAAGSGSTPFDLSAVTLGQKDGTPLPIGGIINLTVQVIEPAHLGGMLTGNVQLEGPALGNLTGITLLIDGVDSTATTTANGDFAFTGLDFGLYTLTARRPGFLSATCTNFNHNRSTTTLAPVTLLAGDISGDDIIDITDAAALGQAIGGKGTSAAVDLNQDGAVNVLDLILLAVNYGQSAAALPWVCQP
ncbi:MAG: hypothetical protein HC875_04800 [Anaerolineales bacterium]|nr:hypothetical protein [Anaerolineales bacterium]